MQSPPTRPPNPFAEWMRQRSPWPPSLLIVGGALTGLLGVGLFAALNWQLLGQPQQRRQALRWIALPGLLVYGALVVAFSMVSLDTGASLVGLHALFGLGGGLAIYRWQGPAYRAWRVTARYEVDLERNNGELYGLIIGFLIATLFIVVGADRLLAANARLPFDHGPLSLTHAATWAQGPFDQEAHCGYLGSECLVRFNHSSQAARIVVITFPFWGSDDLIEGFAQSMAIDSETNHTVREEARWLEVGGQRAYEALISMDSPSGTSRNYARTVYVIFDRRLYIFEIDAVNELTLRLYEPEFDALLDSVTFAS